jgi:transcriptional regulator with XRE-family HTH domain
MSSSTTRYRGGDNDPVTPFYVTLGAALRRTRNAKGLSLQDVATNSRGRFGAAAMGGYERGSRRIGIETLYELAGFYDVPVTAFLPASGGSVLVPLDGVIAQLEALRGAA